MKGTDWGQRKMGHNAQNLSAHAMGIKATI